MQYKFLATLADYANLRIHMEKYYEKHSLHHMISHWR